MPRWPTGLHPYAGSGTAYGYRPVRPPAAPMRHYWRHTATELHAGATATLSRTPVGGVVSGSAISQVATAGPQGAGEKWSVDLVQVQLGGQYGSPPLVTLQAQSQALAVSTLPPPPLVAQAWLSVAGVNVHLLAQTTQGGNDTLDLGGQVLTVGEAITVLWWSTFAPAGIGFPGFGWMALRGTRYAMSVV